ncbi:MULTISPECIES: NAD-dependent epimerase/dehydratase family protein [Dictyoglomus]|uniref:NAD-dependent epimerase/dehydratase n=1 Tax=Dictyoglomus turgidum (strain DSM 6724 / Z-1310) TaxID=515635 RepID=B8DZ37_DICTD|nr:MULTISPECIES: NAD(P)-dependent oxidoreductase [Dictyoglomus]ACK41663.1 NAD-dependent epimerase/dehydratase [Dictyoglomus turgidum DSM 6724]HBU31223.1 NAD(P)-dependent oxidoreductase [Dictyoglomus sp.]
MSKILITGALGVIGVFLYDSLKKDGFEIIGIDQKITDYSDYIRADVTHFEDLWKVFKKEKISTVIHLAGEVGRLIGEEYPQRMVYVNNVGLLNIISLCLEYNSRLIYFSTSEVYGKLFNEGKEVKEEDIELKGNPFITTNIYALSKLYGEAIVKHYVDNYGLKALTIRPFMVYGPGEYSNRYRSAISIFVYNALNNKPITVHKGAIRAWCYISDFIDGVKLLLDYPITEKYEAFNIGSDEYHTMEEVANIIIEEVGGDFENLKIIDPPSKFLSLVKRFSIEKIKNLGYKPKISFREGVREVIKWQKEVLKNYS